MGPSTPTRRLAWAVTLTMVATAMVFVWEPDQQRSWAARCLSWIGAVAGLEFVDGRTTDYEALAVFLVPYSMCVTLSVALSAILLTALVAIGRLVLVRADRPPRAWQGPALASAVAVFGWLVVTLATAAGRLNDAAGSELLPTVVQPLTIDLVEDRVGAVAALVHQLVFPVLVVTAALAPVTLWWLRRRPLTTGTGHGAAVHELAAMLRLLARLLPAYVLAALVVEVARRSYGIRQVLLERHALQWFDDPTFNVATGVLLLGLGTATVRWLLELNCGLVFGPQPLVEHDARPEAAGALWRRLRSDRTARTAVLLLGTVALAACYARLWFDVGPSDIVSTDAPQPPTVHHWLGVDPRGRDQLVRMAAALGGTAFVATVAATIATLAGLLGPLTAARAPRRLVVRAGGDLVAVAAATWLAVSFDDALSPRAEPSMDRLHLAVALGALATPLAVGLLGRGQPASARGLAGPAVGAWLVACAAAVAAEHLSTFLLVQLDGRAPTLGALLAQATSHYSPEESLPPLDTMASAWPALWYPPALVAAVLAVAVGLLATAVLRGAPSPPEEEDEAHA